jgi:pyridoxal biosynthesis lyase PdxS
VVAFALAGIVGRAFFVFWIALWIAIGILVGVGIYMWRQPKEATTDDIVNAIKSLEQSIVGRLDNIDKRLDNIEQRLPLDSDTQKSDNLNSEAKGGDSDEKQG